MQILMLSEILLFLAVWHFTRLKSNVCLVKFPENFSTEMPPAISWLQILMSDLFIPLDSHRNIQEKKFCVGNVVVGNDFELKSWELSH